jgi:hypothetical protein
MNLSEQIERERAARARSHEPKVFIWCEDEADGVRQREPAQAAGRIGPHTEVFLISWADEAGE